MVARDLLKYSMINSGPRQISHVLANNAACKTNLINNTPLGNNRPDRKIMKNVSVGRDNNASNDDNANDGRINNAVIW